VAVLMFYTNPDYVKFFFKDDVPATSCWAPPCAAADRLLIMKKIVNIEV
jgi:hypothetical protein